MSERGPLEWLASTAEVLEAQAARWAAVGSIAANKYRAKERFTTDADLLADHVAGLETALREAGYEVDVVASPGESPHLLRLHREEDAVDVLLAVVEYQEVALARAVDHVLTVEDVVIHKLLAWRARDRNDIESILSTGIALDEEYLVHWVAEWELGDRWVQAQEWRV